MRKSLAVLGVLAIAALLAGSASAANRGVTFTGIGFIDPPGNTPTSAVIGMNPEGTVFLATPSLGGFCVEWTPEGGWGTRYGSISGTCKISSNGVVMANGIYPGSNPVYAWPGTFAGAQDVWNPIPNDAGYAACGSSRLSMFDMAGDGDYATGLTWQGCTIAQAFLWDKATNTSVGLGRPNGRSTRGNAVTADGSAVAGFGTIAQGLRRGVKWENGSWSWLSDPNGEDVKECIQTGGGCTSNSNSATSGCPEFVDDGTCANRGTCTGGVCVGGSNGGTTCTNNNQCAGTCTGPNAGAVCTSNNTCPDTLVCVNNPNWDNALYKGETYDMTDDGQYACGRSFDMGAKFNSGYRSNPDGTFTELEPVVDFPQVVDPFRISQDGKTIAGRTGNFFSGTFPIVWREGVGTIDLQLFLVQQGLDELFFWTLTDLFDISADGTILGGRGINPDGRLEGFIVDMEKVWVCHAPSDNPGNARTLGVQLGSVADHVAHGDFLGTCEFQNSANLSRLEELSLERVERSAAFSAMNPHLMAVGIESLGDWPETQVNNPRRPRASRHDDHRNDR